MRHSSWLSLLASTALLTASGLEAASADTPPAPPPADSQTTVFVGPGVTDDFDVLRAAIAKAKADTGRTYRAVVVKSSGTSGGAATLLPRIVDQWWQARDKARFDPASDVTIVLDIGDRTIAMDVPPSILSQAGLDLRSLEREAISKAFLPRAKDMLYADGLADLVTTTERTVAERVAAQERRAQAAHVFRTRTLPIGLASLVAAGVGTALFMQRIRHVVRKGTARNRLAAFKGEVVALSDLLDGQQERHRMLPHTDPDFLTPMQGMTRDAYDAVQDSVRRYRERWLGLMDVWERAEERLGREWFMGTSASDEVIAMLEAADARPPLAEVEAACRAPLDALEVAHETARELAAATDADLSAARERLEGLTRRGRSTAAFERVVAEATRARELAGGDVEPDPVAARGRLEDARGLLADLVARVDAVEATDDRARQAAGRIEEIRGRVAALRADGWLLAEPGADPEPLLVTATEETALATRLLDAADVEMAQAHLQRAEEALAEAAALLENVAAARTRAEELLPAVTARLEALAALRPRAEADLAHQERHYAEAAWGDVADNLAKAEEGLLRARSLIAEAAAAASMQTQHFFRAVALLEEASRQEDWAESCLSAITDRRRELDGLKDALPARWRESREQASALARRLEQQRTDRARANERCREAERLLELAGGLLQAARTNPRQIDQVVQAADTATARGAELAAEDDRLARQAARDLDEADAVIRRAAAWYAEGVQADVRPATVALDTARGLLERQRYEDAIHTAAEASQQARAAYAAATAEAERRRARRQAEIRRRQMEESFSRMSRGAGPWVINLPGGSFTGPDPWRAFGSATRSLGGGGRGGAAGGWTRDIATGRW
jgi:hypothetical protein